MLGGFSTHMPYIEGVPCLQTYLVCKVGLQHVLLLIFRGTFNGDEENVDS